MAQSGINRFGRHTELGRLRRDSTCPAPEKPACHWVGNRNFFRDNSIVFDSDMDGSPKVKLFFNHDLAQVATGRTQLRYPA